MAIARSTSASSAAALDSDVETMAWRLPIRTRSPMACDSERSISSSRPRRKVTPRLRSSVPTASAASAPARRARSTRSPASARISLSVVFVLRRVISGPSCGPVRLKPLRVPWKWQDRRHRSLVAAGVIQVPSCAGTLSRHSGRNPSPRDGAVWNVKSPRRGHCGGQSIRRGTQGKWVGTGGTSCAPRRVPTDLGDPSLARRLCRNFAACRITACSPSVTTA